MDLNTAISRYIFISLSNEKFTKEFSLCYKHQKAPSNFEYEYYFYPTRSIYGAIANPLKIGCSLQSLVLWSEQAA